MDRRLTTILAADMVGYSRLMAADEEGVIARLRALRCEVIDPAIADAGGRIVKTMGDGLLVEFPSPLEALRCAVGAQAIVNAREAGPEDTRIRFRIGINSGDIVLDGDDVLGDAVNIAARLEGLAPPGGVCIGRAVHDLVAGKAEATLTALGPQKVKNIPDPIEVWRVEVEGASEAGTQGTHPASEKPSIVVLPFDNMSADPDQEFFCDGLVEDVITALSRFSALFVIARNTAFTYRGQSVDVRAVGRELGVRYVLEGSVRRAGTRLRVTAQLIDAETDRHVWAERYDRNLEDIFALQDEITQAIVMAVAPEVTAAEMARVRKRPAQDLQGWEAVARATWHFIRFSKEDNTACQSLLEEVQHQDPDNVAALALCSYSMYIDAIYNWQRPPPESIALASGFASRAVRANPNDSEAAAMDGLMLGTRRQHKDGIRQLRRAIALNPNSSLAFGMLGVLQTYSHDFQEAESNLNMAAQLSPRDPSAVFYKVHRGFLQWMQRDFDAAIEICEETLNEFQEHPTPLRVMLISQVEKGDREAALSTFQRLCAVIPAATATAASKAVPFAFAEDEDRYRQALIDVGMPE